MEQGLDKAKVMGSTPILLMFFLEGKVDLMEVIGIIVRLSRFDSYLY